MESVALQYILRRVKTWPPAAQQEALQSLRAIEADFYDPLPQEQTDQAPFSQPEEGYA